MQFEFHEKRTRALRNSPLISWQKAQKVPNAIDLSENEIITNNKITMKTILVRKKFVKKRTKNVILNPDTNTNFVMLSSNPALTKNHKRELVMALTIRTLARKVGLVPRVPPAKQFINYFSRCNSNRNSNFKMIKTLKLN